jgi:SPOR domain
MLRSGSTFAAICLASSMVLSPAMAQDFKSDGWWVVLASFKENASGRDAAEARVRNAAARCGVEAFNDFSAKFDGFAPGLTVVVAWGAFDSKAEAGATLQMVKPCIGDAYIKKARYLGE